MTCRTAYSCSVLGMLGMIQKTILQASAKTAGQKRLNDIALDLMALKCRSIVQTTQPNMNTDVKTEESQHDGGELRRASILCVTQHICILLNDENRRK